MAEQEQQPDDRPRPRYGELAPPGWVWHPPADADRLDTSRRVVEDETEPGEQPTPGNPYGSQPPPAGGYDIRNAQPERPAPTWNLTLTVLLTVFGFFGMSYSIASLQAIPASMQLLHSTNGLGQYTPAPVVGSLVLAGSITVAAIWVVSAAIAAWLLVKRRLAFWVPLVAGIAAFAALLIFAIAVIATDPVLLGVYSGVTPPPSATPTP